MFIMHLTLKKMVIRLQAITKRPMVSCKSAYLLVQAITTRIKVQPFLLSPKPAQRA